MSLREAAQQALEALEDPWSAGPNGVADAIIALRTALAEDVPETNFGNMEQVVDSSQTDHIADASKMVATSQESRQVKPVAHITGYYHGYTVINSVDHRVLLPVGMALYRSPSQREPLTDEEIRKVVGMTIDGVTVSESVTFRAFARAIEQAHDIGGEE